MYKDEINKKVPIYHQQEYLDNGWQYGLSPITGRKISESLKTSEKHKAACERRRLSDEEYNKRKWKRKEDLAKYRQSQEYKDKIKNFKDKARKRRIEYNKSEAHRISTIESNKRRWKDGCPEKTRKKMSDSLTGKAKGKIWMRKDKKTVMVKPEEYEYYLNKGYIKGRGSNCPWNEKRKKSNKDK